MDMINLKNIHSLSNFLRNAKSHLARLKKAGQPQVLTVNGQAEAVVLSAAAYQQMLDELELARAQNAVSGGVLEAFRAGKVSAGELLEHLQPQPQFAGIPADKAFAALERKFAEHRKKKAS
jgi:PHD/YefM family antitoxin component YafN of YafNO toxin-antitoxin module